MGHDRSARTAGAAVVVGLLGLILTILWITYSARTETHYTRILLDQRTPVIRGIAADVNRVKVQQQQMEAVQEHHERFIEKVLTSKGGQ